MPSILGQVRNPLERERQYCEVGKLAQHKLNETLERFSDQVVNWKLKLQPQVVHFMHLAAISDAERFRLVISFLDSRGMRVHCESHFEFTHPQVVMTRSIEDRIEILVMEVEHACVRAINFMLEKHGTTLNEAWDKFHERLDAAMRKPFDEWTIPWDQKGLRPQLKPRRRRLGRKHAPWRITH